MEVAPPKRQSQVFHLAFLFCAEEPIQVKVFVDFMDYFEPIFDLNWGGVISASGI
jgi:hypothetical protein